MSVIGNDAKTTPAPLHTRHYQTRDGEAFTTYQ